MDCHGRIVTLETWTGGVLAVLSGQHVPTGVHRGGAPRGGVSVYPGAPVALSPLVDEGEHTVPAAPTGRGRGRGRGRAPVVTHVGLVSVGSEGEPVLRDEPGVVREVGHSQRCLCDVVGHERVGVVVDSGSVAGGAVREDCPVASVGDPLLDMMSVTIGEVCIVSIIRVVVTAVVVADLVSEGVVAESAGLLGY